MKEIEQSTATAVPEPFDSAVPESDRAEGVPKRQGWSRWGTGLMSSLILVAAAGGALGLWHLRRRPEKTSTSAQVPRVLTALVRAHTDGFSIEVDGQVVPFRRITVAAEVAGRVASKAECCQEGCYVEAGTLLAQIDDRDYRFEVQRLEEQVRQAEVMLRELEEERDGVHELITLAKRDVELKQKEVDRLEEISQVVSATDLEQAQSRLVQAQQAYRQLQNQYRLLQTRWDRLQSAKALADSQLAKARLDLERTQIKAPVSGMIIEDLVEAGDYVQKGTPLVTLEDTSKVEVRCSLEMRDLFWIWGRHADGERGKGKGDDSSRWFQLPSKKNVDVIYTLTGLRERHYEWRGRLDRFEGFGLDEKTRTVPCRVVVDEPRREGPTGPPVLLPGMFVTVRIPVEPKLRLLEIPARALRPGNVVWRVRGGKLTLVEVELVRLVGGSGESVSDRAIIHVEDAEALRAGDAVAVTPLLFVKSGMKIEAVPWQQDREQP